VRERGREGGREREEERERKREREREEERERKRERGARTSLKLGHLEHAHGAVPDDGLGRQDRLRHPPLWYVSIVFYYYGMLVLGFTIMVC